MATIVCQKNTQHQQNPYLDSHLVEPTTTTTLRLKLSPPQTQQLPKCHSNKNDTEKPSSKGGWSFLQSLPNPSHNANDTSFYTPRVPGSILSERSLALCTESLGSETGTTDWFSGEITAAPARTPARTPARSKAARSFPPPLTTISGDHALRVKSTRVDGRLIVEAVRAPRAMASRFVAERSEGRLRLRLAVENDIGEAENDNEEGGGESGREKEERGRIEKFGRGRGGRCKEGGEQYIVENKTMLQAFWVAT